MAAGVEARKGAEPTGTSLLAKLAARDWSPERIWALAWRLRLVSPCTPDYPVSGDEIAEALVGMLDRLDGRT